MANSNLLTNEFPALEWLQGSWGSPLVESLTLVLMYTFSQYIFLRFTLVLFFTSFTRQSLVTRRLWAGLDHEVIWPQEKCLLGPS